MNEFMINPEFLDINRKYYYADSYVRPFNQETIQEMNQWISEKTEGMFQEIINNISANTIMYLFNTMIFQGEWQKIYYEDEVREGTFIGYNGKEQEAFMMYSTEGLYLNMENAKGFIKPYENGYSFAALLPEEGIDIEEFIQSYINVDEAGTQAGAVTQVGVTGAGISKLEVILNRLLYMQ